MGKAKRKQPRVDAQASAPPQDPRFRWVIHAVLFLTTLLVYAPVLRFDFVNFDDPDYVTRNAHVLRGLTADGVSWAFTSGQAANWFPLTRLSHMLDVQLFGINGGLHHFTNVMIHGLAVLLLFAFLDRATGDRWPSAFVAFLFALHPLHVESVAWISERKDVLSAFFWFLALWGYVRYAKEPSAGRYGFVLLAFALGLMCKPMIVTLPFLLLLLDFWPLRRPWSKGVLFEKLPFFVLTGVAAVITYLVQQSSGAVRTGETFLIGLRIENALVSYGTYISQMLWPSGLAIYYPYQPNIPAAKLVTAGALLVGVSLAVVRYFRECPYLAVGWCWYLGTLVPVIGLVQVGDQAHADRYAYVPSVGLCIMLAWGATDILKRWPSAKIVVGGSAALACLASVVLCEAQIQFWKNSETLFRHAIEVTDGNYLAHYELGVALSAIPERLPEAISQYQAALKIEPHFVRAHTDYGNALAQIPGRLPEAVAEYRAALRTSPDSAILHNDLGNALASMPGGLPEAIAEYETALRLGPDHTSGRDSMSNGAELQYNMALALARSGQTDVAISHFEAALRLKPDYVDAHINIGVILASSGRVQEAIPHFEAAVKIDPGSAEGHANLGMALSGVPGRMPEAIDHLEAALRIKPDPRVRQVLDRLGAGR
jgi:tetratricopeptide (TPR) repeat protein